MQTIDEITIHADPDVIFRTAAEVERWPEFLPHYRWVKVLEVGGEKAAGGDCPQTANFRPYGERRLVEMAARRGPLPVKWTSIQRADPQTRRVYYEHVGGPTRGMTVVWSVEPAEDGMRVSIVHDFTLRVPLIRSALGRLIVAQCFVEPIAGRTLRFLKRHLEG